MVRAEKKSGVTEGSYGPQFTQVWTTPEQETIVYQFSNPINGSPEGKCHVYDKSVSSDQWWKHFN
jgi:hypothetical protein